MKSTWYEDKVELVRMNSLITGFKLLEYFIQVKCYLLKIYLAITTIMGTESKIG